MLRASATGEIPCLFFLVGLAPAVRSRPISTPSPFELKTALERGVLPYESTGSTTAPASNKTRVASGEFSWAEKCKGRQPLSSAALTSAPLARRDLMHA